jgi:uncharacterized protein (DUF305 family)
MSRIRFTLAATATLVTGLTLVGCSSNPGSGSMEGMDHGSSSATPSPNTNTGPHNDADVTFAMEMVPHHQQAVEMADMILAKDGVNSDVFALAETIKAAQGPEIDTMQSWLDGWGVDTSATGMEGMDHGTGMMSADDLAALDSATGNDASKLFLQQMMQHHQGAIDMANFEVSNGENPDAVGLANKIVKDQTAEIAEMQILLGTL